jgi:type I restriction-modification system DNA methylase subunit
MKLTKERAKKNLSKLIERFEKEYSSGRIKEYNEEATKTSFIQPFLKEVLGWNVNDRDEVSPEEKISHGRVDYGLKVEGRIKIFIEAKPPRADLNRHIEQAVSYGYNRKGVPFVLLTDFEELKLFDVTVKPDSRNLRKGLKIDLQWDSYLEQFDKIWWLSRESVVKDELDQLLLVKPKERVPVDKAILEDLTRWRECLAKDIFKNNSELFHSGEPEKDADYLKEITQKILDRIIFMRFCEDRRLVHSRSLKELFEERTDTVGTNTMVFLKEQFRHCNIIFDSDLFRPQEWENGLAIDFKVMREIIEETYHPYQFDVIPLEVLGNIYEQYLGYTIRLTDHQLKYELKPEVPKAGGVYYTPEYIVDYIVKNTVGKLLQELPPKKIKKLRILDPACGSGSFLIRAYEEMLIYYRNQKKVESKSKEKQRQLKLRDKDAEPHLSIREKSQILREHIFGVDIDDQAVEVTKLSLMLKMLEGEHGMVHGRGVLPMLDENIKCGNSLISGDTLQLKSDFGEDLHKVNAFDWDVEFRKIMKDEGGFDVVIGNPPYVSATTLRNKDKVYYKTNFKSAKGRLDTYGLFTEKSIVLLKDNGYASLIVPNKFLTNLQFRFLRNCILNDCYVSALTCPRKTVFDTAAVNNVIFVLRKKNEIRKHNLVAISEIDQNMQSQICTIDQAVYENDKNHTFVLSFSANIKSIESKIRKNSVELQSICSVKDGIIAGRIKELLFVDEKQNEYCKPLIFGDDMGRYSLAWKGRYVNYRPELMKKEERKRVGKNKGLGIRLRVPEIFEVPKILTRKTADRIIATYDPKGYYFEQTVHGTIPKREFPSVNYILGIMNSKLYEYYYKNIIHQSGTIFPQVRIGYLKTLPVHNIDIDNPSEKKLHDNLVSLVDVILDLNKKIQTAKGSKKEQIQRQIEKTDREIDEIVYKLYGITEKERKIIEGEL